MGRQHAGGIAGVDPRLFDMLHDGADDGGGAVGDGVHVDLDGVLEELVDQDRVFRGDVDGGLHVVVELAFIEDDAHGAAAQDIRGPHHHRVADAGRDLLGLVLGAGGVVVRLNEAQFLEKLLETLAVFGAVDAVHRGPEDGHSGLVEVVGQVERGLAAELDDHSVRAFLFDDMEHVLAGQGLEIELVRGVVVGAHRLRVGVDHDAFDA